MYEGSTNLISKILIVAKNTKMTRHPVISVCGSSGSGKSVIAGRISNGLSVGATVKSLYVTKSNLSRFY